MFKLAGSIVDCYDDPKFMSSPQAQAYLGKELLPVEQLDKLGNKEFAVRVVDGHASVRKFPVYNDFITKISCAYFVEHKDQFPIQMQKAAGYGLANACKYYNMNVPAALKEYENAHTEHIVELSYKIPEAAIRDEEELAKHAAWTAAKEFPKMTPEDRVILAAHLDKEGAAAHRQEVYDYVPKAEYGPLLEQAIKDREYILKSAEGANGLVLLGALRDLYTSRNQKDPLTFAVELANFDKIAGLRPRYSKGQKDGLTDPYKSTFGGSKSKGSVEHGQYRNEHENQAPTPVDVQTGQGMSKESSEQMTVAQHLDMLAELFPTGSQQYKEALGKTANLNFGQKFKTAWQLFFS